MSPGANDPEMAYAVHTRTCTYLLDVGGVCRWIVSQQGVVPPHIQQCIGAQFVACLDFQVDGGLSGDLRVGGRGLFVRHAGDKLVLLRTGTIQHVDDRRTSSDVDVDAPPPPAAVRTKLVEQYGKRGGLPYRAKPPPRIGIVHTAGEEQTITVSNPLIVATQVTRAPRRR
jgi:hypothetical protein